MVRGTVYPHQNTNFLWILWQEVKEMDWEELTKLLPQWLCVKFHQLLVLASDRYFYGVTANLTVLHIGLKAHGCVEEH